MIKDDVSIEVPLLISDAEILATFELLVPREYMCTSRLENFVSQISNYVGSKNLGLNDIQTE